MGEEGPGGQYAPGDPSRSIIWKDGRVFRIDSILDFRPASTLRSGHPGDCYTVMIQGEEKYLFFQRTDRREGCRVGRWWVERAVP